MSHRVHDVCAAALTGCLALVLAAVAPSCSPDNGAKDEAPPPAASASTPAATSPPTVASAPAPRPPLPPARDADQDFLRHMLDHHETVITLVHAAMMEPAGHAEHGGSADPAEFDSALDAERQQLLGLLRRLYDEEFSPRADTSAPPRSADTEEGAQAALAARLREGVALADRFLPRLRHAQVRAAASRIRASQLALARQVAPAAAP